MNESETRAELIDPALHAAGWGVVEGSRNRLGIDLDMRFGSLATARTNTAQYPQNALDLFERHLDALAAETQRLQKIYEQKQAALAELKMSLLHQAFGEKL
jgi:Holliday junction resolvasome RuvABC endonuclease subunit